MGGGEVIYSAGITWKMFCQVSLRFMGLFFLGMKWILKDCHGSRNRLSGTYAEWHLVNSTFALESNWQSFYIKSL